MKRLTLLLVSIIFIYTSCDVIDNPIVSVTGEYNTELYGDPPVFTVTEQTGKNVLVEDFTAHQCGNCPPAAVIAEGLMAANPNRFAHLPYTQVHLRLQMLNTQLIGLVRRVTSFGVN